MAQSATSDFLATQVIVGKHIVTGMSDGDSFALTWDTPTFELRLGNRGLMSRFKRFTRSATITLTMLETSDDNDIFSAFWTADYFTPGGLLTTFSLADSNGRTVLTAPLGAWFTQLPDVTIGDGTGQRVWTMQTALIEGVVGGKAATPLIDINSIPDTLPAIPQAA